MKFSNIRLLVDDFDKCFTFYSNILALECTWGKPGENYASFSLGSTSAIALFKAELMGSAINSKVEKNEILQDKIAIIIQVDNIDETYISLQDKGVQFLTAPKDMSAWGIRAVHFRDPENNLFELYSDLPQKMETAL
jgi:lactoylglutathione lyase